MMMNVDKLKEYLDSKTNEELKEEWDEMFPPENDPPKGWVSIEEHLPKWLAIDVAIGCSTYKVKYKDGTEGTADVSDHDVWYYIAKKDGITHWWNG